MGLRHLAVRNVEDSPTETLLFVAHHASEANR
jgi:hypothetical protein